MPPESTFFEITLDDITYVAGLHSVELSDAMQHRLIESIEGAVEQRLLDGADNETSLLMQTGVVHGNIEAWLQDLGIIPHGEFKVDLEHYDEEDDEDFDDDDLDDEDEDDDDDEEDDLDDEDEDDDLD